MLTPPAFGAMARKKKTKPAKKPLREKIARELYRTHGREIPHEELVAFLGVDPLPRPPMCIQVSVRVIR
ncbi:protein of unknown function [Bradyrhizobium sp. ORS 285]|nr:hypothetical protein BRAO285_850031 [Bradyrhizobium sp. ORS 285]SMX61540.1 protein of unknown function [Bradyrhizobium sp. ORS 285]